MRAAADILSSPAAMQIRQLEAWQAMAKTSHAKVIFVPQTMASMAPIQAAKESTAETSNISGINNIAAISELASQ